MVQRIFADYCKGVGLFAIAQVLTREELAGALDDAGLARPGLTLGYFGYQSCPLVVAHSCKTIGQPLRAE
jgi:hypothetical protein